MILAGCGMRMHQTRLVDEWGNTYEQSASRLFTDREVYHDQTVDVWGMEKPFARILQGLTLFHMQENRA